MFKKMILGFVVAGLLSFGQAVAIDCEDCWDDWDQMDTQQWDAYDALYDYADSYTALEEAYDECQDIVDALDAGESPNWGTCSQCVIWHGYFMGSLSDVEDCIDDAESYANLAEGHWDDGSSDESIALWNCYVGLNHSIAQTYFVMAEANFVLAEDDWREAERQIEFAVFAYESAIQCLGYIASCEECNGD